MADKLNRLIKKGNYTVTTNSSGYVAFTPAVGKIPISAVPTADTRTVTFFKANTYWYARVVNDMGNPVSNEEITFDFYYI